MGRRAADGRPPLLSITAGMHSANEKYGKTRLRSAIDCSLKHSGKLLLNNTECTDHSKPTDLCSVSSTVDVKHFGCTPIHNTHCINASFIHIFISEKLDHRHVVHFPPRKSLKHTFVNVKDLAADS